jgi:hypothetical protein
MTDAELDQLVFDGLAWAAECRKHNDNRSAVLILKMSDALTTERARVVELEAFRNGYKDYIRKLQDSAEAERAKVAELEVEVERLNKALACDKVPMLTLTRSDLEIELAHFKAEAARWREVAGDLAQSIEEFYASGRPPMRAALARFKQESGQ